MDESDQSQRPDQPAAYNPVRSLVIVGATITVLIAFAIGLVLLFEDEPSEFPEGSPERVFQEYLELFRDRDFDSAYAHFSTSVQEQLPAETYVREASVGAGFEESSRVAIEEVTVRDGRATLTLSIERTFGEGIDRDTYTEERVVPLVRESGAWRLDTPMLDVNPAPWLLERGVRAWLSDETGGDL